MIGHTAVQRGQIFVNINEVMCQLLDVDNNYVYKIKTVLTYLHFLNIVDFIKSSEKFHRESSFILHRINLSLIFVA